MIRLRIKIDNILFNFNNVVNIDVSDKGMEVKLKGDIFFDDFPEIVTSEGLLKYGLSVNRQTILFTKYDNCFRIKNYT